MDLTAVLAARRALFEAHMRDALDDVKPEALRDAARWYPDAGGKRLRPAMALLACEAAGGAPASALPVALAVELVHNFSLVHDDIMDRDATRRGRPTVHVKWDEPTAILAGDVLLARAFEALAAMPDATSHRDAARVLSEAVRLLCEGQALDMAFERRGDVTSADYLHMIRGKTAVLFAAATEGGALCAGRAGPAREALRDFGEAFGMAFQVADDLLDATGDPKALGKPWGSDIRAGKRTLLVLTARERASREGRAVLDATLGRADASDDDVRAVVEVLRESGALARAEALRDEYAERADAAAGRLPSGEARDALRALNAWATTRSS